jgi:hypothetical protein
MESVSDPDHSAVILEFRRSKHMKLYVKDIVTELGIRYQIWNGDEPVSYIFTKASAAVRLMRRMNNNAKGGE